MRKLSYLVLAALVFSCAGQNKKEGKQTDAPEASVVVAEQEKEEKMLLGLQDRAALEQAPFGGWYEANYEEYSPEAEVVEKLKPLSGDLEIRMFMGTWCEDSQREVPAFFKLLDALDFPKDKVTLITMDREKTTPGNLEDGLEVSNVPTIMFIRDGKELNRIVEYPIESLEKDMLSILRGEDYKHAYAW